MIARILAVLFTWMGIELLLAIYCLQYGLMLLLIPGSRYDSVLTVDLAWQGYGASLGLPFLLKAAFTGSGVIANLRGCYFSWLFRFVGAFIGAMIWIAMSLKYLSSTAEFSFGMVVSIDCFVISILIMAMAWHDFPEPKGLEDSDLDPGSTVDAG